MARLAAKTMGGCLVLVLTLSSLAGLVCADGPDEKQAMECCRGDAHHCNMPEKTEDCCKPDRSSQNPASVESAFRTAVDGSNKGDPDEAEEHEVEEVTRLQPPERMVSQSSGLMRVTLISSNSPWSRQLAMMKVMMSQKAKPR